MLHLSLDEATSPYILVAGSLRYYFSIIINLFFSLSKLRLAEYINTNYSLQSVVRSAECNLVQSTLMAPYIVLVNQKHDKTPTAPENNASTIDIIDMNVAYIITGGLKILIITTIKKSYKKD